MCTKQDPWALWGIYLPPWSRKSNHFLMEFGDPCKISMNHITPRNLRPLPFFEKGRTKRLNPTSNFEEINGLTEQKNCGFLWQMWNCWLHLPVELGLDLSWIPWTGGDVLQAERQEYYWRYSAKRRLRMRLRLSGIWLARQMIALHVFANLVCKPNPFRTTLLELIGVFLSPFEEEDQPVDRLAKWSWISNITLPSRENTYGRDARNSSSSETTSRTLTPSTPKSWSMMLK